MRQSTLLVIIFLDLWHNWIWKGREESSLVLAVFSPSNRKIPAILTLNFLKRFQWLLIDDFYSFTMHRQYLVAHFNNQEFRIIMLHDVKICRFRHYQEMFNWWVTLSYINTITLYSKVNLQSLISGLLSMYFMVQIIFF